jgi:prophage regulatory protein
MEQTSPVRELADEAIAPLRPLRLIRLPDVIARVGIKRSMIYRLMSEGRFPKSRSLGPKCAVWVESEIDDWAKAVADQPR